MKVHRDNSLNTQCTTILTNKACIIMISYRELLRLHVRPWRVTRPLSFLPCSCIFSFPQLPVTKVNKQWQRRTTKLSS